MQFLWLINSQVQLKLRWWVSQVHNEWNAEFQFEVSENKGFALFNIQNFGILNFIHGFHENSWVLVLKSMFKWSVSSIFNCIFYQMPYSTIQDLVYVRISWQMKRKLYALTQKWSQTSFSPFCCHNSLFWFNYYVNVLTKHYIDW